MKESLLWHVHVKRIAYSLFPLAHTWRRQMHSPAPWLTKTLQMRVYIRDECSHLAPCLTMWVSVKKMGEARFGVWATTFVCPGKWPWPVPPPVPSWPWKIETSTETRTKTKLKPGWKLLTLIIIKHYKFINNLNIRFSADGVRWGEKIFQQKKKHIFKVTAFIFNESCSRDNWQIEMQYYVEHTRSLINRAYKTFVKSWALKKISSTRLKKISWARRVPAIF